MLAVYMNLKRDYPVIWINLIYSYWWIINTLFIREMKFLSRYISIYFIFALFVSVLYSWMEFSTYRISSLSALTNIFVWSRAFLNLLFVLLNLIGIAISFGSYKKIDKLNRHYLMSFLIIFTCNLIISMNNLLVNLSWRLSN